MVSIALNFPRDKAVDFLTRLQAGEPIGAVTTSDEQFALAGACLFVLGYSARSAPHFAGLDELHREQQEAKTVDFQKALLATASSAADLVALIAHPDGLRATAPTVQVVVEPSDCAVGYAYASLKGVDQAVIREITGK